MRIPSWPGAPFSAEEAAGYPSYGVQTLLVVNCKGKEVDVSGKWGGAGCGEEDGITVANGDGTIGLESEPPGLDGKGIVANLALNGMGHGWFATSLQYGLRLEAR